MTIAVEDPFFAAVAFEPFVLPSTGRAVRLPLRYRDYATFAAQFPADAAAVRAALPSPALVPREVAPGRAAVSITAYDHRLGDLAPYRELGVSIPVTYRPGDGSEEVPSAWSLTLPVTTEEARVVGVDVWGVPKYLAEITFEAAETGCRCRVRADGRDVLTLEVGPVPLGTQPERAEFALFTAKDGELLRTVLVSEGRRGQRADGAGVRLVLGDHPRAAVLRRLGLGSPALGQSRGDGLKMLLPRAERRFPLEAAPA